MNNYTLTFSEWTPSDAGTHTAEMAIFYVEHGEVSRPIRIILLLPLRRFRQVDEKERASRRKHLLLIGLPRVISKLNQIDLPAETTSPEFLITETIQEEEFETLKSGAIKKCLYQKKQPRGLICEAATKDDLFGGKTAEALCQECNLPDDRIRCSRLQHPDVKGVTELNGPKRFRAATDGFCHIRTERFDLTGCFPGGLDCWTHRQTFAPIHQDFTDDLGERLVDEFKYLDLAIFRVTTKTILKVNDPRVITNIATLSPCVLQDEFVVRVASLSDIINSLTIESLIGPTKITGSVNQLAEFLKRGGRLLDEAPLKALRRVISIRNGFPLHSGNKEMVSVFAELGLSYPPESWDYAWKGLLNQTYKAIKSLRLMVG